MLAIAVLALDGNDFLKLKETYMQNEYMTEEQFIQPTSVQSSTSLC